MTDIEDNLYHENIPNVCTALRNSSKKCCKPSTFKHFLPIMEWLPKYNVPFLAADCVAGLTVGLTAIPQAIAYAAVAGLPAQYGLYSAFMGCFVYIIFGTCKDITVGPTAIMALMVQSHVTGSPDYAVLSCFLSGCVILCMGLLNLGVLVRFISIPVTAGFTTAAAITIASGQINSLFGIKSSSNEFLASWETFFHHIGDITFNDSILGVSTLVILLLMRNLKDLKVSFKTFMKYMALARNALAVIVGILLCYFLSEDVSSLPFKVGGKITPGLPDLQVPPFSTTVNGTTVHFNEMIDHLGASLASIPLISILESIAVAKAFSKGKLVDASQEMIALGLCNILGSFVSSMPTTGSFTRTAINNSSGVKTPFGGAITGVLVLLTLAFLTNAFYYIPKATLAAIIISAMIFMVEYERILEIWRGKKLDLIPFLVTALVCLFWSLEYGMVCGICVNVLFILYKSARPKIVITSDKINALQCAIIEVRENLCYASAEYLKCKIVKFVNVHSDGNIHVVIIKGTEITNIDSTVGLNILSLRDDLNLLNCQLICWNWNMDAAGVICRLHPKERHIFKFGPSLAEIVAEVKPKTSQDVVLEFNDEQYTHCEP